MSIANYFIENPRELEVPLYAPSGSNQPTRLFIYTGILIFDFMGNGANWLRDTMNFEIGHIFYLNQVRDAVATASLNNISNKDTAFTAGRAVDSVIAYYDPAGSKDEGASIPCC